MSRLAQIESEVVGQRIAAAFLGFSVLPAVFPIAA
jgi:hypothetical protein